ncbi:MAG: tetratricopeptide repeat protein [Anaeromicrobium sp.]|nr:tetratricopeptide repeat protein [Anaeromicrobium sp.]
MFKSMAVKNIVINAKGTTLRNEVDLIMAATDNAINKIYNMLVVTTIFFTVIVASISIFQYLKIKESNEIKKELEKELEQVRANLIEYQLKFKQLENDNNGNKNRIKSAIDNFDKKSAEIEVEVSFIRADDAFRMKYYDSKEIRFDCYNKILKLNERYPGLISKVRLSNTYCNLGVVYYEQNSLYKAKEYFQKSLDLDNTGEKIGTLKNIGMIEYKLGNLRKSVGYFEKVYCLNENNLETIELLIKALNNINEEEDIDKALKYCTILVKRHGHSGLKCLDKIEAEGYLHNIKIKYKEELNKLRKSL